MCAPGAEQAPLASTFVGLIEPYEEQSAITSVQRLGLETPDAVGCSPSDVALEVHLADGRRDVVIARDVEKSLAATGQAQA